MALDPIDFEFLAWLERIMCVPTFYTDLLEAGVEKDVALVFAYSEAVRKRHSVISLYQDYGIQRGPSDACHRGFMQYINYYRAYYDAIGAQERARPVVHTCQQAPFEVEEPLEEFPFSPLQQQTLIDALAVPLRREMGEGYDDTYYVKCARPIALVAMKWAQGTCLPAKPIEITPENEAELKHAMAQCAVDQLGDGYMEIYYRNFAGPFFAVAKWWVQNLLKGK